MDVPGHAVRTLPEAEWDALLRVGLRDSHASVRCAAAALTFASDRGAAVEGEVLANLRRAKGAERHFSLLSLSAAASAASVITPTQVAMTLHALTDMNGCSRRCTATYWRPRCCQASCRGSHAIGGG
jgi:hypothetical protein